MIRRILVRLETTSGYVRHYSKKDGRRAQLPPDEQNRCLQCLTRCLIPHDLIILHRQTHANCNSVLSCSCLNGLIEVRKSLRYFKSRTQKKKFQMIFFIHKEEKRPEQKKRNLTISLS